jgi:outer membrane protein, heavy metal efflux system
MLPKGFTILLVMLANAAIAQSVNPSETEAPSVLHLNEVLQSVRDKFPLLEGARRDTKAAEAEVRASEGAFDIQWRTRAITSPMGYYQNERIDSILEQPTTLWGTSVFAGYRLGTGNFAIYDGKMETNEGGEVRAGLSIPLLRDGPTDRRRVNIKKASLGVQLAEMQVRQQSIDSVRTASHRYWDWVAAGQRVEIFRSLLAIAEERDKGLAERVKQGDLPDFERQDNLRAILQRRSQLIGAERALQQSSIELSLLYRDGQSNPVLLTAERLPKKLLSPGPGEEPTDTVEVAAQRRPDLLRFVALREQNELERRLAVNQAGPRIDATVQMSRSLQLGDPTRNLTQMEAGLLIEVPLQANVARGREDSANATELRLEFQERFVRDRIHADINDARSALEAARLRVDVTAKETQLARNLEQGERERFVHGDSNQLFVNLREQATADAAVREIEALADYRKSLATLLAALGLD